MSQSDGLTNTNSKVTTLFSLSKWLFPFCMNDKFKFACKVGLSLTLAYLIPMAMGWPQASTAATTVMLIASTGSKRESLAKGSLRVLGTVVGAVLGLSLVGIFAQDNGFICYRYRLLFPLSFIFEMLIPKIPRYLC